MTGPTNTEKTYLVHSDVHLFSSCHHRRHRTPPKRAFMLVFGVLTFSSYDDNNNDAENVTILLLSHATLLVTAFVIYYSLLVPMHYGTTSVVDIYFSLFAMFTDFYDVPYHSI